MLPYGGLQPILNIVVVAEPGIELILVTLNVQPFDDNLHFNQTISRLGDLQYIDPSPQTNQSLVFLHRYSVLCLLDHISYRP